MLVNSPSCQRMTNEDEGLVAAKRFLQVDGIDVAQDVNTVTYVRSLFDRHQIIEAEGAQTESLFTGPEALKSVTAEARAEILAVLVPRRARGNSASFPRAA